MGMEVQVRSEETGIWSFSTIREALDAAKDDLTIWKISFDIESGERVRLVKNDNGFFEYHSILDGTGYAYPVG